MFWVAVKYIYNKEMGGKIHKDQNESRHVHTVLYLSQAITEIYICTVCMLHRVHHVLYMYI